MSQSETPAPNGNVRIHELLDYVRNGKILEAMEAFYADDVVMTEPYHTTEGKAAIARAVAALVPEHASVFIAIGTTTAAVAQELLQNEALLVVTNDL